ncbi:DUF5680 domain-containing protein [Rhizobium sp. SGZ-381]|uniref:DUF5680 domain-containing protein n=1 Tax=Rhizobium sp. SGZ-381 TaxID=3342800 RepID=UPI00366C440F
MEKGVNLDGLLPFIVEAKAAAYIGGKLGEGSCRPGSRDIPYRRGAWSYLDSYFGGTDFLGQEVVWRDGAPVWAMNYYGRVLDGAAIDGSRAANVLRAALPRMYAEGRFLGGFAHDAGPYRYLDASDGDHTSFTGVEQIIFEDRAVYRLDYHGGLVIA